MLSKSYKEYNDEHLHVKRQQKRAELRKFLRLKKKKNLIVLTRKFEDNFYRKPKSNVIEMEYFLKRSSPSKKQGVKMAVF